MLKKKIVIDKANRLYQLPPDILSLVRAERRKSLIKRVDALDLASFLWPVEFDPEATIDTAALRAAPSEKVAQLKEAIADWMASHQQIRINPVKEIFVGGRITNLLFNLALAFIEPGDIAFVPAVGIPTYRKVVAACGGEAVNYGVSPRNDWVPDFERLGTTLGRVARLLFLNSPHNPTGAELNEKEMADLVWTAARENILLVNDAAYQAIPSRPPVSLLSIAGGKQVGIEVYSFSYLFGLPPLPYGFVAGNREVIAALQQAADLTPPYVPDYFVDMALHAIRKFPNESLRRMRNLFSETAAESGALLNKLSLEKVGTGTVPFVWAKIERRSHSGQAARVLYRRSRILAAPGTAFGESGQGFLRFSLTCGPEVYRDAAARIKRKMTLFQTKGDE